MDKSVIYFDNAATTRVCPEAIAAANEALTSGWYNPSSLYERGMDAEAALNRARSVVARSIGAFDNEVIFTSGGTESNNIAVLGLARARKLRGKMIVATAYEHPSVQNTLAALVDEGFEVALIKPKNGVIDPDEFVGALTESTILACAIGVNNETGALIDIPALAARARSAAPRAAFHCDWVQGYMKLPISLKNTAVDTLSISGHKIHAPKGIGALYIKRGTYISGIIHGGRQEGGRRAGTENTAFAAAMAAAVQSYDNKSAKPIKDYLLRALSQIDGVTINTPPMSCDSIVNFSQAGYKSETLLHFFESRGILVSSGSACSKGERSHTLAAMGLSDALVDSAIRVSLCGENTMEQAKEFIDALTLARETLIHR